jgi:hypothetical protein
MVYFYPHKKLCIYLDKKNLGFILGDFFINSSGHSVARWHIVKPKILIWLFARGTCNGRCWYILWPHGLFCGHLVYFMFIWYFSTFWYATYTETNLQPCDWNRFFESVCASQGDQIGQIFAYWVIVYFGCFLIAKVAIILYYFFHC